MFGVTMSFVIPAIIYIRALQQKATRNGTAAPVLTVAANGVLLLMGVSLSAIGTYNTLFSYGA